MFRLIPAKHLPTSLFLVAPANRMTDLELPKMLARRRAQRQESKTRTMRIQQALAERETLGTVACPGIASRTPPSGPARKGCR
jgi:hypothetical protein